MCEYIKLIEHFKDGDRIVCVDNSGLGNVLKTGTTYIAVRFNTEVHCISSMSYTPQRFITLKEYRKQKLIRIEDV